MTSDVRPRKRNATATREAILNSARKAFARSGYDGAGVREIAAGAGVTAMLVNRYFGSKEQLFAEAIAAANASPTIATEAVLKSAHPGRAIADALVSITEPDSTPLEGFQILLHSSASTRAAEIGRNVIEAGHQKILTAALRGRNKQQRAALILSLVAGFQMMRQSIAIKALADADPKVVANLLTSLFDQLLQEDR